MPARPEIRAFLSLRMFVLSVVSRVFVKRFFWVEDKETLNLSRNRKKRYRRLFLNGRDC